MPVEWLVGAWSGVVGARRVQAVGGSFGDGRLAGFALGDCVTGSQDCDLRTKTRILPGSPDAVEVAQGVSWLFVVHGFVAY